MLALESGSDRTSYIKNETKSLKNKLEVVITVLRYSTFNKGLSCKSHDLSPINGRVLSLFLVGVGCAHLRQDQAF